MSEHKHLHQTFVKLANCDQFLNFLKSHFLSFLTLITIWPEVEDPCASIIYAGFPEFCPPP